MHRKDGNRHRPDCQCPTCTLETVGPPCWSCGRSIILIAFSSWVLGSRAVNICPRCPCYSDHQIPRPPSNVNTNTNITPRSKQITSHYKKPQLPRPPSTWSALHNRPKWSPLPARYSSSRCRPSPRASKRSRAQTRWASK